MASHFVQTKFDSDLLSDFEPSFIHLKSEKVILHSLSSGL